MNEVVAIESAVPDKIRDDLKNKIIAVGLNSLANAWSEEDKALLNQFITFSLRDVLPTWHLLSDKVRFQIFVNHIDSFKRYMEEQISKEG